MLHACRGEGSGTCAFLLHHLAHPVVCLPPTPLHSLALPLWSRPAVPSIANATVGESVTTIIVLVYFGTNRSFFPRSLSDVRSTRSASFLSSRGLSLLAMPPRKGESQRDKALRHKRMAAEYNRKARFTRLMDLLSKREDLLYKVEEHLIDSGDMDEFVPTGMERRDSKPLLAIGDEEHVEDESDRVDAAVMSTPCNAIDDAPFNRNVNKIGDLCSQILKDALHKCDPSAFSHPNLKSLMLKGQRQVSQESFLQLLEMVTDLGREDSIDMQHRTKFKVITWIAQVYARKGCRGKSLSLPVNWVSHGPYPFMQVGDTVKIVSRFEKRPDLVLKVPEGATMYIDIPYSFFRATLRQQNSDFKRNIHALFEDEHTRVKSEAKFIEPRGADPAVSAPIGKKRKAQTSGDECAQASAGTQQQTQPCRMAICDASSEEMLLPQAKLSFGYQSSGAQSCALAKEKGSFANDDSEVFDGLVLATKKSKPTATAKAGGALKKGATATPVNTLLFKAGCKKTGPPLPKSMK